MAQEIRTGIKLTGDASGMTAAFVAGGKAVGQLDDKIDQAGKGTKRLTSEMGSLGGGIRQVAAAVGAWQLGGAVIRAADDMTTLQSRLKLVTSSANEQVFVQQRLQQIANDGRVSWTGLGETYARMASATEGLGYSQERLLSVTQTIAQAMTIGGGSAESMNAALIQLGQGIASGTLRGEELNSVMEQTPRLAQAIAQGMGISKGELRALAQEGKLTADAVFSALEKSADGVSREFAQMGSTISQSLTVLKDSGKGFVAEMDKATGASVKLSSGIKETAASVKELGKFMSENMGTISVLANGAAWAIGLGAAAVGLGKVALGVRAIGVALAAHPALAAVMLGGAAVGAWAQWGENKQNSLEGMKTRLKDLEANVTQRGIYDARTPEANARFAKTIEQRKKAVADLRAAIDEAEGTSRNRRTFLEFERGQEDSTASTLRFPGAKPIDEVKKYAQLGVDIQRDAYDKSVDIAKAYQNRMAQATSDDERVALQKEMGDRLIALDREAKGELAALAKQGTATAGKAAEDYKRIAEAQLGEQKARMELSASIERQDLAQRQRTNEQLYRLGLLDVDTYYQRKAELATQDLDISARLVRSELEQAKTLAASAKGAEDKARAQAKVLGLERELVDLATQRQAAGAEPGNEADARAAEQAARVTSELMADRVKNTKDAYAQMARMDGEMQRLQVTSIRDPGERARAQLEAELQVHRERIALITNDSTRADAEAQFADYVVAKHLELNERLKPAWQQMLEDWKDTSRLMKDAYNDTMEGMLRDGETAFVNSGGNLLKVAGSMVDQLQAQLMRLVYKRYVAGFVESLGSAFMGAIDSALGGGVSTASSASSAYSLTSGSGSSGLGLQMRASGGAYGPGLVLRGENGPELSWENSGGYVFNSSDTRQMLGGGGGATNITVKLVNESGTALQATSQRQTTGPDGGLQIEVIVQQIENRIGDNLANRSGAVSRGFESGYGVRPAMA